MAYDDLNNPEQKIYVHNKCGGILSPKNPKPGEQLTVYHCTHCQGSGIFDKMIGGLVIPLHIETIRLKKFKQYHP